MLEMGCVSWSFFYLSAPSFLNYAGISVSLIMSINSSVLTVRGRWAGESVAVVTNHTEEGAGSCPDIGGATFE
jgi:hypothetical protein